MKITHVSYGKTINIGNYQSVRVELTAELEPGETHHTAIFNLKHILKDEEQVIAREYAIIKK